MSKIIILLRILGYHAFRIASKLEPSSESREGYISKHASQRLIERYGIHKTRRVREYCVIAIQYRKPKNKAIARLIRKYNGTRSLWEIKYHGVYLYPIYDNKLHDIVTYLTEDMVHDPKK